MIESEEEEEVQKKSLKIYCITPTASYLGIILIAKTYFTQGKTKKSS